MTPRTDPTDPRHERGYIPLIDNRLRCKACEQPWPCAEAAQGTAPRAEGLDSDELLSALSDILRWTKPGSLFMDGTHGYSPAGPEKVARIHNRARAAFGDAPLPPAPAAPRAEGLDVAAEVASEMRTFLHGARLAPPVAPGWLAQIEKWHARLSQTRSRDGRR